MYFPFASREKKFKNNWTEEDIPGWVQLAGQGDVCIITKSYKDVAALDSWGFNVIGQRGEFIPIGMDKIEELKSRFNRVVTLFDNDGKFYKDYPLQYLHVPKHSGKKDPTDYARAFGVPAAIEMVNDLLHQ